MTVALVAGGATGIGAAVVRSLRRRGDAVLLADRNAEAGKALVDETLPGPAAFLHCDFSRPDAAAAAVEAAAAGRAREAARGEARSESREPSRPSAGRVIAEPATQSWCARPALGRRLARRPSPGREQ